MGETEARGIAVMQDGLSVATAEQHVRILGNRDNSILQGQIKSEISVG